MMDAIYAISDDTESTTAEQPEVAGRWADAVKPYKLPHRLKSWWQIINSVVPFFALLYVMYLSTFWSYWLTLALAVPAAGLLVRLSQSARE
jgi:fatty acid desaturase